MKPQLNEPCNYCKYWSNRTGCKLDRYNSTSMVMFGHCGFWKQKSFKPTDIKIGDKIRPSHITLAHLNDVWVVHRIEEDLTTLIRARAYHFDKWDKIEDEWKIRTDNLVSKKFTRVL